MQHGADAYRPMGVKVKVLFRNWVLGHWKSLVPREFLKAPKCYQSRIARPFSFKIGIVLDHAVEEKKVPQLWIMRLDEEEKEGDKRPDYIFQLYADL